MGNRSLSAALFISIDSGRPRKMADDIKKCLNGVSWKPTEAASFNWLFNPPFLHWGTSRDWRVPPVGPAFRNQVGADGNQRGQGAKADNYISRPAAAFLRNYESMIIPIFVLSLSIGRRVIYSFWSFSLWARGGGNVVIQSIATPPSGRRPEMIGARASFCVKEFHQIDPLKVNS